MAKEIKMPDLGTAVKEVALVSWLKEEGDSVKRGEALCEVETDKATSELESIAQGVLLKQAVPAGSTVAVGDVIAYVGQEGELISDDRQGKPSLEKTSPILDKKNQDKEQAVTKGHYSTDFLLKLYRDMVKIRHFEERVKFLFLEGIMPGTIHQCQGQEACAVGVCSVLELEDIVASTHRPHGHCLAKGMGVDEMMAELFGRTTGCCKGKGGSMHMGNLDQGVIPAIAIVGGNLPLITGVGLSIKMKKEKRVAVSFMGDGATNEGAFHESLNMAAIWNLPVVFVVENNFYGASTSVDMVVRTDTISERASIYKMPGVTIDGNDVLAVYEAAEEAVERARAGKGPSLLELRTYRITGHSRRDPALYQPEDERKEAQQNEPIGRFGTYLVSQKIAEAQALEDIKQQVDEEIEAAVEAALAAPEPAPEDTLNDIFVEAI